MKRLQIPSDLTTLAHDSIKQYILEGRLGYETRLTETLISEQLGISRSPIREALNSLATEGLITIEPRRGATLRRFTAKEAADLYDLRRLLEIYAVETAVVTPELVTTLGKSIDRLQLLLDANRKQDYIEEDMKFHSAIAAATGNQTLVSFLENIQNKIWLCRCKTYDMSSSSAPQAHRAITNALKSEDRGAAKLAMGQHIQYVSEQLTTFLNQQQATTDKPSSSGQKLRHFAKNGKRH